jgi:hypothetical protein
VEVAYIWKAIDANDECNTKRKDDKGNRMETNHDGFVKNPEKRDHTSNLLLIQSTS